jgi:hypothetical protein
MNRREFLSVLGGVSAVSMLNPNVALAADTTSLYVKGLVMFDFENPDVLRLGFPKAPGHKATLAILPEAGEKKLLTMKGHGTVDARNVALDGEPKIFVPELVRMREFYGDSVKSKVDQCPSVISIPCTAIRSVSTAELSKARYSFSRADDGREVNTFRPRQVAETIKIELSSAGTLKLNSGKVSIPLQTAKELRMEYAPERIDGMDAYADHFHHYFSYVERPAALDFDVVPKKLGANSKPTPKVGHHFMMFDFWPYCFPLALP